MAELKNRILETLHSCPYGLTAQEVAERIGATPNKVSSALSKLAAYGIIEKTLGRIAANVAPRTIYGVKRLLKEKKTRI